MKKRRENVQRMEGWVDGRLMEGWMKSSKFFLGSSHFLDVRLDEGETIRRSMDR